MPTKRKSRKIPSQEALEKRPRPQEIERRFLIRSLPENLDHYPHEDIVQGYLAIAEDGTEVRLRQKGKNIFKP